MVYLSTKKGYIIDSFCSYVLKEIYFDNRKRKLYFVTTLKKLAAIFFFALFLFNIIGYRITFFYAQQQSDIQLLASLDKNHYNESELVIIKVPLSLPYVSDQAKFERVDGEISYGGKIYKYVKRRISEGNLILLCLPDYSKMRLTKEKNDFFKNANCLAQTTGSKQENAKGNSFKNIFSEYDQFHTQNLSASFPESICYFKSAQEPGLTTMPHSFPEQPPELA